MWFLMEGGRIDGPPNHWFNSSKRFGESSKGTFFGAWQLEDTRIWVSSANTSMVSSNGMFFGTQQLYMLFVCQLVCLVITIHTNIGFECQNVLGVCTVAAIIYKHADHT